MNESIGCLIRSNKLPLLWYKFKGHRINAVTATGRPGPIHEQVSEVPSAFLAQDFRANHPVTPILFCDNVVRHFWVRETGPPRARIKFRVRVKEGCPATRTAINALPMIIPVFSREGRFRVFLTEHLILFFSKLLTPFDVRIYRICLHTSRHRERRAEKRTVIGMKAERGEENKL